MTSYYAVLDQRPAAVSAHVSAHESKTRMPYKE